MKKYIATYIRHDERPSRQRIVRFESSNPLGIDDIKNDDAYYMISKETGLSKNDYTILDCKEYYL